MNTETAEHQKVKVSQYGDNVTFSSPFGFSGGEGEVPGQMPTGMQQGPPQFPAQQFAAPPPFVDGCFGAYHQTYNTVVSPYQNGQTVMVTTYETTTVAPAPPMQPQGPLIEGFLAKRGEEFGKPWNKRWFRLMPSGELTYGKDQKTCAEKRVDLFPYTLVRALLAPEASREGQLMGSKKPLGFEIFTGNGTRTWFLDAGSKEKLQAWIWTLNKVIYEMRACGGPPACGGMPGPGQAMHPGYMGQAMR